jgi:hypothetical protein
MDNEPNSTVDTGLVSDHQPVDNLERQLLEAGIEPGSGTCAAGIGQLVAKAPAKAPRKDGKLRPGGKKGGHERRIASEAAVLVAEHLKAGDPPPVNQLQLADPQVLASEIRTLLGLQRPAVTDELEDRRKGYATVSPPLVPAIGRPTEYTEWEADELCQWIADGNSMNQYCKRTGRRPSTIYRWLSQNGLFREKYSRAHDDRADTLVDHMLAIVDSLPQYVSMEDVKRAELQVNTRKWCAERMRPTKWGMQQQLGNGQPITFNIGITRDMGSLPAVTVDHAQPHAIAMTAESESQPAD